MEDIYTFLKKKLKENNIKIGAFIEMTNVSKSTIYRVMKGFQKPSDELLERIINILNLNTEDRRKLNYYISTIDMDESSVEASNEVKKFIFEPRDTSSKDIEFIYYKDEEKYIKSFESIIDDIHRNISGKSADIEIHIANATEENTMNNIIKNIGKLANGSAKFKIEHLVGFSKNHPVKSIRVLKNIIPMLEFDNYSLFYTDTLTDLGKNMFNSFMLISYRYREESREEFGYYVLSFLNDNISTCYIGYSKDSIYDMFLRNYNFIKDLHIPAVCKNESSDFASLMKNIEFIDGSDDEAQIYLFKRTPCYKRIPPIVFKKLKERIIESNNVVQFVKNINQMSFVGEQEAYLLLDAISGEMIKRYEEAKSVSTVDILSKNGLIKFAQTGLLSDHFNTLPEFTKEDIIAILSDMKKRHEDPDEKYRLYIIGDTEETNFVLTVFKDRGFLIEHANEDKKCDVLNYCMIEDKDICNILYEFGKEYVPTRLAMNNSDAVRFLDELIESVKKELEQQK